MPEYVRVKDKSTGHVYTVLAREAETGPDAYEVLDAPAVNANGDPLPPDPIDGPAAPAATPPPSDPVVDPVVDPPVETPQFTKPAGGQKASDTTSKEK